jgi:hypothetical protein
MMGIGGVSGFGRGIPMVRVQTPAQELETGVRFVAFFLYVCYLIRLWSVLDPQPGPLTDAVTGVSQETFDGYFLVLGIFLYGLFMLLRFLVRPVLRTLQPAPVPARILAWAIVGLVAAAILSGRLAELTGVAVLAAMGLNWVLEAAEPEAPLKLGVGPGPSPPKARPG